MVRPATARLVAVARQTPSTPKKKRRVSKETSRGHKALGQA